MSVSCAHITGSSSPVSVPEKSVSRGSEERGLEMMQCIIDASGAWNPINDQMCIYLPFYLHSIIAILYFVEYRSHNLPPLHWGNAQG